MIRFRNYIGGKFVDAASGRTLEVFEPAAGRAYAQAADSGPADVEAAVKAATLAFPGWASTPVAERSLLLDRLAGLIEDRLEDLARAESIDTGKPISLARRVDIPRAAANFRYFAGAALHTKSDLHEGQAGFNWTLRRPRGVAGLISPWNLPLYLLTWKIAPALATGNTVVAKPSEVTPATGALLCELAAEAGLPPGVLNIVHGRGDQAGAALVNHPDVPTISFTGSTGVGRWIAEHAGSRLKRVSLELGGKNPFVVFADSDIDAAIATACRAAFTNQGQICLCGSRMIVERSVYDRFVEGLIAGAKALKIGDPLDDTTDFGSLVSRPHHAKVARAVEQAKALGGEVLVGGGPPAELPERCREGWFYGPTVIAGLAPDCAVEQDEIFGPVVSVRAFDGEEDAVRLANSTPYGLASVLFTDDLNRARRVSEQIRAGIVWVNCWMLRDLRTPFGGMGQSGVGREGGEEALKFFTEPKNVCIGP